MSAPLESWESRAVCRGVDPEVFFGPGALQARKAKRICRSCPVVSECLAFALNHRIWHGVWGGLTERERRRVLRRFRTAVWTPELARNTLAS